MTFSLSRIARAQKSDMSNGLNDLLMQKKREGVCVYLRFRNSISASGVVVTYSNPFSMSSVACSTF